MRVTWTYITGVNNYLKYIRLRVSIAWVLSTVFGL